MFDYSLYGKAAVAAGRRLPIVEAEKNGLFTETMISYVQAVACLPPRL